MSTSILGYIGAMIENNTDDAEWEIARAIWAAGKVDIPAQRDGECEHFLSDLRLAAGMYKEASRVTAIDQQRDWSFKDGAQLCSELLEFLYRIDHETTQRTTRATKTAFDQLLVGSIFDLIELEHVFRKSPEPPKVRRRKHDTARP